MTDIPAAITPEEVRWLCEPAHQELLQGLATDNRPLHQRLAGLRRQVGAERAGLLIQQQELRRRGEAKFTTAGRMLFTRLGYEQATDESIAYHKAQRFAPFGAVADLCCGIGGDTAALAKVTRQLAA